MTRSTAARHARNSALGALALALAAAAGHAQTISFDNTCGTNLWHGGCATVVSFDPVVCLCWNNWDNGQSSSDNCHACPSEPGAADNVFIGNIYVDADYTAPIRSLTTTSLFRNSYIINVSFTAFYGGPVVGRGSFAGTGTHTFASTLTPDPGAQNMEMLWPCTVELNGPLNIGPGAGFGVYTTVNNNATATWSSDIFRIDGAYGGGENAVFRNRPGALFLHTTDGEMRGIIGLGHYENAGTFRKDGGLGSTAIGAEFKNLAGALIDVRTGSLLLNGESTLAGSASIAAGATLAINNFAHVPNQFAVTGPGTLRVNNGLFADAGAVVTITNLDGSLNAGNVGTLRGPGTVNVTGSANIAGTLGSGVTLSLAHGCAAAMSYDLIFDDTNTHLDNHGVFTWTGGNFRLGETTSFNNMPGGVLDCRVQASASGYFFTTGSASNAGTLRKTAGGRTSFTLPFTNTGTISCEFDRLAFSEFRQTSGQTILAGGELDADFQVEPLRFEGGTLRGTGNIRGPVLNTGAIVAPGASPGAISISGGQYGNSYSQGPGGTLRMEIGGTTPTTFDRLAVDGPVTLDGALEVSLINGFVPQVGQTFNIITCTSRSGQFANVSLPPGLQLVYTPTTVALMLAGPAGCNRADVGSLGGNPAPDGALTVDDVVAFLSAFFANNITVADIAALGGGSIPDGQVTVDDLVTFLAEFFTVCP